MSSSVPTPSSPRRPQARRTSSTSGKASTILLIDDDPSVCEALRRVLTVEGWNVLTAQSGEQALRRLATSEPDLMITDLCMTKINGWDLLFHEKLQRPGLPIFVITALPRNATNGADRFATQFFQKPLDLDALITAIRHHLDEPHGEPLAERPLA
jgi:two-component system response regulator GlrR